MESQIEQQFFQYLSELGFPKSSVIYEPVFQPRRNYVDARECEGTGEERQMRAGLIHAVKYSI